MKPIQVKSSSDGTVSVQISKTTITDHTGAHPAPDEILLLIEDEKGDHIATFTILQVVDLIKALHRAANQIAKNCLNQNP